ncbi:hypothetical protein, partial [Actinoplanes sp. NPDC051851]|uniref:hypothetical protein n=1 Tax=Actinoplanes sp. NPDC051851 TaxID=3154753 RepID=UPI00343F37D7
SADGLHYLRPETAQGIFVNYNNVATAARKKPSPQPAARRLPPAARRPQPGAWRLALGMQGRARRLALRTVSSSLFRS